MTKSSPSIWHYLCRKCQIDGEDFINFCGLLRKHELYQEKIKTQTHKVKCFFGHSSLSQRRNDSEDIMLSRLFFLDFWLVAPSSLFFVIFKMFIALSKNLKQVWVRISTFSNELIESTWKKFLAKLPVVKDSITVTDLD